MLAMIPEPRFLWRRRARPREYRFGTALRALTARHGTLPGRSSLDAFSISSGGGKESPLPEFVRLSSSRGTGPTQDVVLVLICLSGLGYTGRQGCSCRPVAFAGCACADLYSWVRETRVFFIYLELRSPRCGPLPLTASCPGFALGVRRNRPPSREIGCC